MESIFLVCDTMSQFSCFVQTFLLTFFGPFALVFQHTLCKGSPHVQKGQKSLLIRNGRGSSCCFCVAFITTFLKVSDELRWHSFFPSWFHFVIRRWTKLHQKEKKFFHPNFSTETDLYSSLREASAICRWEVAILFATFLRKTVIGCLCFFSLDFCPTPFILVLDVGNIYVFITLEWYIHKYTSRNLNHPPGNRAPA